MAPLSLSLSHTGNSGLRTGKGVQAKGRGLLPWHPPAASWGEWAPGSHLKGQLTLRRRDGRWRGARGISLPS